MKNYKTEHLCEHSALTLRSKLPRARAGNFAMS